MPKRLLTKQEIEQIVDFVQPNPYVPKESAEKNMEAIKNSMRKQLVTQKVYPKVIPRLKKRLELIYMRSLIQPGESVGIICGQSIGEKNTQSTLNTFHRAGMSEKTVTSGVPRFKELIGCTQCPRNVNHIIHFTEKPTSVKEIRNLIGSQIIGLRLKDLVDKTTVCEDKSEEPWYDTYRNLYESFTNQGNCISFTFDIKKLFAYKITLKYIANKIKEEYDDLICVYSPSQYNRIDIFVSNDDICLPEERLQYITKENYMKVYMEDCVVPQLNNIAISGINGVTEIFYNKKGNELEGIEWIAETNSVKPKNSTVKSVGTNAFKKLLALDIVDFTQTISNDMWDIYEVLGIEAARQFLIEEFSSFMGDINMAHIILLVDKMTFTGTMSAISRNTLNKDDSGVLGKATFETSTDNFLNAAVRGEKDPVKGVSAQIICGRKVGIGAGMSKLGINIDMLPDDE